MYIENYDDNIVINTLHVCSYNFDTDIDGYVIEAHMTDGSHIRFKGFSSIETCIKFLQFLFKLESANVRHEDFKKLLDMIQ